VAGARRAVDLARRANVTACQPELTRSIIEAEAAEASQTRPHRCAPAGSCDRLGSFRSGGMIAGGFIHEYRLVAQVSAPTVTGIHASKDIGDIDIRYL
jgi:hypothetical protein